MLTSERQPLLLPFVCQPTYKQDVPVPGPLTGPDVPMLCGVVSSLYLLVQAYVQSQVDYIVIMPVVKPILLQLQRKLQFIVYYGLDPT